MQEEVSIPRDLLEKYFKDDPRLIAAFENQSIAVAESVQVVEGQASATSRIQDATVVTLSPNEDFNNEFLLTRGEGTRLSILPGSVKVDVDETVARSEGNVMLIVPGGTGGFVTLFLPASGNLVSDVEPAQLYNKTLNKPIITGLVDCNTDEEAAAAGVPVNGMYRDGNVLCIRRT